MSAKENKHAPRSSSSRIDISTSNSTSTSTSTSASTKPISHRPTGSGSATTNRNLEITHILPLYLLHLHRLLNPSLQKSQHHRAYAYLTQIPILQTIQHAKSQEIIPPPRPRPRPPPRIHTQDHGPHPAPDPHPTPTNPQKSHHAPPPTELLHTRETLHLLQTAHTSLHNTYLGTDSSLRLLRSTHAECPSASEVQSRIGALMTDRDAFREAYNEAMAEMRGEG
ncbi:hypothetical protein EYC84_010926 [Monilinia fructicola]|uniref:Uncharacterized protein n=1 Tax=Monilinia fructicola TaxID=38448 RepID=A0A5M9JBD4_MONFR|nr:hypothetical protein EYC84_010926 [Monilinia fructicola]